MSPFLLHKCIQCSQLLFPWKAKVTDTWPFCFSLNVVTLTHSTSVQHGNINSEKQMHDTEGRVNDVLVRFTLLSSAWYLTSQGSCDLTETQYIISTLPQPACHKTLIYSKPPLPIGSLTAEFTYLQQLLLHPSCIYILVGHQASPKFNILSMKW